MIINLVEDWVDYDTGEVDADQLAAYADELKGTRDDYEADGQQMPSYEASVLRMLLEFMADVTRLSGNFEAATLVPDARFEHYVRHCAEEEHGLGPDTPGDYVDWPAYAKAQENIWESVELDGQKVWVCW